MQNKRYQGFTLLEILLVIAAIGILAAIVLVAINPNRQLAQARNAIRQTDINTIQKAIEQGSIDNGGQYNSIITGLSQPTEICGPIGGCGGGYVDLSSLVPTYIAAIPKDPQAVSPGSGYKVFINPANNKISVTAGLAENSKVIANNPVPWTPASLGSALSFWADANDESSLTLNNQGTAQTASQWNDKSGNIRHLTQGVATQQPTLVRGMGNLLRYTQELENNYWSRARITTIATNAITAPDGTMTADGLVPTSENSGHYVQYNYTGLPTATNTTASVFLKTVLAEGAALQVLGTGNARHEVRLNFSTGIATFANSPEYVSGNGVTTGFGAENYGNGWWRIWVSGYPDDATTDIRFRIIMTTANGTVSLPGDDASTYLYAWGAMLTRTNTLDEYIGRNAFATDGVDDFMSTGSFVLSQPYSRFSIITRRNSFFASNHILNSRTGGPNVVLRTTTDITIRSSAGSEIISGQPFSIGQTSIFGQIYDNTNSSIFNNGLATNGPAGTNSLDGLTIGASNTPALFSQNDIHSVLILNRLPTTDERQKIEGYLAHRYGIQASLPGGHPYKDAVPIWN